MTVQHVAQKRDQWRQHLHVPHGFGERAADAVAAAVGSWTFVLAQTAIVTLWVIVNVVGFIARWDPYPFILLNLLFSTQAAYTAPILMMSQNRQATKDRLRDDHEADEIDLLYTINQQQLEILHLLHAQICPGTKLTHAMAATTNDSGSPEGDAAPDTSRGHQPLRPG